MRRTFLPLIMMLMCLCCFGCPDKQAEQVVSQAPFQGLKLKVAVPQGIMSVEEWQNLTVEWATRTGAEAEFIEIAVVAGESKTLGSIAADYRQSAADLMLFPLNLKPALVVTKSLQILPESVLKEDKLNWENQFAGFKKDLSLVNNKKGLIPLAAPTFKLYLRKDLLAQAQRKVPDTWDELLVLIHEMEQWAPGKTAVMPWSETDRSRMLLSIMMPYVMTEDSLSMYVDFLSGESSFQHPGYAKGMGIAKELLTSLPKEVSSYSALECRREILEGRAAIAICDERIPQYWLPTQSVPATVTRDAQTTLTIAPLPGVNEFFDKFNQSWKPNAYNRVRHITVLGDNSLVAGEMSGSGANGSGTTGQGPTSSSVHANENVSLAAGNLLHELMRLGLVDASGKSILSPTFEDQLTSTIPFFSDDLNFEEQTELLQTIQTQLSSRLCPQPVLTEQSELDQLITSIATKLLDPKTEVQALSEQLATQAAAVIKTAGPDKVRQFARGMLGMSPDTN
jgi:ABC-type glycerol-3-phosphate transport system substrate-binding protein